MSLRVFPVMEVAMSRTRLALFFSIVVAVTVYAYECRPGVARASRDALAAPALLVLQSSTFQRVVPTASSDSRGVQCMRRTADWERNRTPLSVFFGSIIFLAFIYLLT